MKAKGRFISFLLVVDTFFVAYAYGFHSRQILVVDPKLPPVVPAKQTPAKTEKIRNAHPVNVKKPGTQKEIVKKETAKPNSAKHEDLKKEKKVSTAKAKTKTVPSSKTTASAKITH